MQSRENNIYSLILNSIADLLYSYYEGAIAVESNYIKQGFKEPCFFIDLIDIIKNPRLENKQVRTYQIDIQYLNGTLGRDNLNAISEDLLELLELVRLRGTENGYIRAYKYDRKIVADVLHFIVTYHVYIEREKGEVPKMNILNSNVSEVRQ